MRYAAQAMKIASIIGLLFLWPSLAQGQNTARMLSGVNAQTGTSYTFQNTDVTKLVTFNNSSAVAVTLPAATTSGFGVGSIFSVRNLGTGTVTITPTTSTIDGATALVLPSGAGADIYSDGLNYQSQKGSGTGGGGGGGSPGAPIHSTQCNNGAGGFSACVNNSAVLYVSTSGNDGASGLTWDTAKLTIMAAVCALPGGNCAATPPIAGNGTVYFGSGVSCNANANAGCWIAGPGDSQYPTLPSGWTIKPTYGAPLSLICATLDTIAAHANRPTCGVVGPNHTVATNLPLVWLTGGNAGIYIFGLSGTDGVNFTAQWGRIGIDSATTQIINPVTTQTSGITIENSSSTNFNGGTNLPGYGPQLALGNGFWVHLHDDQFGGNNGEACQISSVSRSSGITTITTTGCGGSTSCPFLNGDHLSIKGLTDSSFNGTFVATSACSGGSTVTFNQTGYPNFSGSVGSAGTIADDRAFGVVCYGTQVEMSRIHEEGSGIKFYGGANTNLQLNDVYMEGAGVLTTPNVWFSPILNGGTGLAQLSGVFQADTPQLPSMINDGGQLVSINNYNSTSTSISGPSIIFNGNDNLNRTTGLLVNGQSGWYNNSYLESNNDISRRQVPLTSSLFTNIAPQNPASWTGTNFSTTPGVRDPFGGTGAIEADATAGTTIKVYQNAATISVGDVFYFGTWIRAVNGTFTTPNRPITLFLNALGLGGGDLCSNGTASSTPITTMIGDGNWFWLAGSCTIIAAPTNAGLSYQIGLDSTHAIQLYRPYLIKVPVGTTGTTTTEIVDEFNSLAFGPSTQSNTGDIVFPADKKLCLSSGSALNEFCGYLTHSNTANRTYTLPDASGTLCLTGTCSTPPAGSTNATQYNAGGGAFGGNGPGLTGQLWTSAGSSSPPNMLSPGIPDGNGGVAVTTTPYTIQCDSGIALVDRAHILRFQAGASAVTVPQSIASGCGGNFVVSVIDESVGALTFSRTGSDTFSVYGGGTPLLAQTSFTLSTGQYATLTQGASGIWEVRISGAGVGQGAAPLTATVYISPNCPTANLGNCINTPGDTQQVSDCGWTTSNGVITCTNAHFTAADVGKSVMGFQTCNADMTLAHATGNEIAPNAAMPTIIAFNSGTSVTISATPANAMTITSSMPPGGCFVWGHIDDTGFANANTVVQASTQCPKVELAAGYYLITTPPTFLTGINPTSCAVQGTNTGNPVVAAFGNVTLPVGFDVEGRGVANTEIFLSTNFPNGDSCQHVPVAGVPNPLHTGACFAIPVMGRWRDWAINGGGQGAPTALVGKTLGPYMAVGTLQDWSCYNYGAYSTTSSAGIELSYINQLYQVNNAGCGSIGIWVDSSTSQNVAVRTIVENSSNGALIIGGATGAVNEPEMPSFICYWCDFAYANSNPFSSPAVVQNRGGVLKLIGGKIIPYNANDGANTNTSLVGYQAQTNNGSLLYAYGVNFDMGFPGGAGNNNTAIKCTATCVNFIRDSTLFSQASGFDYQDIAGSKMFDLGGNITSQRYSIAGQWSGNSVANNVVITAAKLVLSGGWGSTAAWTSLNGLNAPIVGTITNSGTGQGASPTITYTFPLTYPVAPYSCTATQVGGTNTVGTFTSNTPSTTAVTFTFSLTPTASSTEIVQITCVTP